MNLSVYIAIALHDLKKSDLNEKNNFCLHYRNTFLHVGKDQISTLVCQQQQYIQTALCRRTCIIKTNKIITAFMKTYVRNKTKHTPGIHDDSKD